MKSLFVIVVIFAIFLGYAPAAGAGFGISPPSFSNDHLSPGAHYEQNITLVQGKPKVDVEVSVRVESAEEIESWLTFKPGKIFIIPAGVQQFPLRVIVDVPKDAGYATYTGKIHIVAKSIGGGIGQGGGGAGISVLLGATANISLTVTSEKITDFRITGAKVAKIEEGWPIQISVGLENLGNVKVRPTRISIKIYDEFRQKILQEGDAKTNQWVDPFTKGSIIATMPTNLGVGKYFADYEIYKGGNIVARDKNPFSIVEKGTIDYWPRIFGVSIAWWLGGIVGIAALFAIIKFNLFGKLLGRMGIEVKRKKR